MLLIITKGEAILQLKKCHASDQESPHKRKVTSEGAKGQAPQRLCGIFSFHVCKTFHPITDVGWLANNTANETSETT
ncbi:Hypothetical protein NTJ_00780 [Nesidiocoris tenuis]|uniref:Uncharacterized protein n=1 Tax=Nesidiocoris tenuis TaxID=355587 RepID=A0ABN7A9Z7_9HEMI|nr:Hypothetical protein NTJ_00780 [Nesidiocoris tenuis]